MRALKLDFHEDRRLHNLVGFALLAMALVLAASLVWYYKRVSNTHMQLVTVVESIERRIQHNQQPMSSNANGTQGTKEVIAYYGKVIQKLNLPWDNLFVILEKAKGENVALLGVEPNAKDAKVKLSGEAKDFKSMFDYVRALREQPVLKNVYLLDHKIDDENPDKPIRFTLEAAWTAKP